LALTIKTCKLINKKMIPWYIWFVFAVLVVGQLSVGIYYSVINFDKDIDIVIPDVTEISEDTLEEQWLSRLKILRDSLDNADHQDLDEKGSIEVSSESELINDRKVRMTHSATGHCVMIHTLFGYPIDTSIYANRGIYFELTPTFETSSGALAVTVNLGQFADNFVPDAENTDQKVATRGPIGFPRFNNSTNFVIAHLNIENRSMYLSGKDGMVGTVFNDISFESGVAVGISVNSNGLVEVYIGDEVYAYGETAGNNFIDFSVSAPPVYVSLGTEMTANTEHITYAWNAGQDSFEHAGSVDGRVDLLGQDI
jgi:hypothetical protein